MIKREYELRNHTVDQADGYGGTPGESAEEHAANACQILRSAKALGAITPQVVADAHERLQRALTALSEGRW